ncbi:hypothetical protein [Microbacterium sp. bgisy203]|uniref:hypothetical protein n=1 Tax=Microbacterium sp. bgisy203 TaxID=3413799 RepID=UPI003D708D8E
MSVPGLAPRGGFAEIVAVWIAAAVVTVAIALAAPAPQRAEWLPLGLAACVILAFVIQLARGHAEGFLRRVAASVLGALVVMGLVSLGLALASLVAL